jgi:acyl-CoA thioester hydrolase
MVNNYVFTSRLIYDFVPHHYDPKLIQASRSDNDMYAHLNNSIYSFLFDSIINTYLIEHCGLDPHGSSSLDRQSNQLFQQIGLVVSSSADFFGSVSFPDVLDLGLRVTKLGTSSVTYEVGVFKKGEESVKVVGGFTHVFVLRHGDKNGNGAMRPTPDGMNESVRQGLKSLLVYDSTGPDSKL